MTTKRNIGVEDAYALETPADNIGLYRDWAASYDRDFVEAEGYILYRAVAGLLLERRTRVDGAVLDIGCGTGVVGEALRAGGIEAVDGIDISAEMLAVAGRKTTAGGAPVYRELIEADLTQAIDLPDGRYGALVSAGTFTHGHLGPDALGELWRVAAAGAPCVVAVRTTHYSAMGFGARLAADVANGTITEPELVPARVYSAAARDARHADDEALIVVCTIARAR